jgi:hypothetical protein
MESDTRAYADFIEGIFRAAEATTPSHEQLVIASDRLASIAGFGPWDLKLVEQIGLLHHRLENRRPPWRTEWAAPLAEISRHLSDPENRERLAVAHARIIALADQIKFAQ